MFSVFQMALEERGSYGQRGLQLCILRIRYKYRADSPNHRLVVDHFVVDVCLIEIGSRQGLKVSCSFSRLFLQGCACVAVGWSNVQLRPRSNTDFCKLE